MLIRFCIVVLVSFGLIISASCFSTKSLPSTSSSEVIIDDEKLLLGPINESDFQSNHYKTWFDSTYSAYEINQGALDKIAGNLNEVTVKLYLGTWCSDSRREVPAFYKIIDALDYNKQNLSVYALDRSKTFPGKSITEYNIEYVPTFIFYRNEKEIGRIIESPTLSIEEDMYAILSK